mmetsp:Transcript_5355/g.13950  ORF Transcript_5355/g.13950 Transcript_5355/m.13950 type:complete len:283 (+) Transcript_5355:155-1003(+)
MDRAGASSRSSARCARCLSSAVRCACTASRTSACTPPPTGVPKAAANPSAAAALLGVLSSAAAHWPCAEEVTRAKLTPAATAASASVSASPTMSACSALQRSAERAARGRSAAGLGRGEWPSPNETKIGPSVAVSSAAARSARSFSCVCCTLAAEVRPKPTAFWFVTRAVGCPRAASRARTGAAAGRRESCSSSSTPGWPTSSFNTPSRSISTACSAGGGGASGSDSESGSSSLSKSDSVTQISSKCPQRSKVKSGCEPQATPTEKSPASRAASPSEGESPM